jgi:predicted DNA-binding transcriptional regulator YafY
MEILHHDKIEFDYVNWKGIKGHRKVEIDEFHYGSTKYHPETQWLLEAFDLDKNEFRIFAMKDMSNVKKIDA